MRGQVKPRPAAKMPASKTESGKNFIAQKIAERKEKSKAAMKAGSAPQQQPGVKKEEAKVFLKGKAKEVAKKKEQQPSSAPKGEVTKKVMEKKAPAKEKKEAVLTEARKKMGMSEEKRAEFQQRSKDSKAKRVAMRQKEEAMKKQAPTA